MKIENVVFENDLIKENINVKVILPREYDNKINFPVLYVNDGNFLFYSKGNNPKNSIMYEEYYSIFNKYLPKLIIIAIISPRNSTIRTNLYVPYTQKDKDVKMNEEKVIGKGKEYLDFLTKTIKPFVDENYKTLKENKYTGICGFSSGAFNALYGVIKYPHVFTRLICISPAVYKWENELEKLFHKANLNHIKSIYLDVGDKEEDEFVYNLGFLGGTKSIYNYLTKNNINKSVLLFDIVQNRTHEIYEWKDRFYNGLRFIYNDI